MPWAGPHSRTCKRYAGFHGSRRRNPAFQVPLITDGKPENVNQKVKAFIKSTCGEINQLVALRDIAFSNSAAESIFRTLKGWYLPPEV